MSDFEAAGRFLYWKTVTCPDNTSSPIFTFHNSHWFLLLTMEDWGLVHGGMDAALYLYLSEEHSDVTKLLPFQVTCLAKIPTDSGYEETSIQCAPDFVQGNRQHPFKSGIFLRMERNLPRSTITFILMFESQDGSPLDVKAVKDDNTSDLSSLSADLGSLLESGRVTDVQLKTKGNIRSAHRSVLAARSEVFSAMFLSEMKESTTGLVDISDVDGEVMDLFLQYLYTGGIPKSLGGSTLVQLYAVGDKYAVHSLKRFCRDLMMNQVSEGNYQEFLVLADAHSDEDFKDKVIKCIVQNPKWLDCRKWFDFSKRNSALAVDVYQKFYDKTYFKKT